MLQFSKEKDMFQDDVYVVTEIIFTFNKTTKTIIKYTRDLKKKQINDEPWRNTNDLDVNWFNRFYSKHFIK